jgi:hypothetical protein
VSGDYARPGRLPMQLVLARRRGSWENLCAPAPSHRWVLLGDTEAVGFDPTGRLTSASGARALLSRETLPILRFRCLSA